MLFLTLTHRCTFHFLFFVVIAPPNNQPAQNPYAAPQQQPQSDPTWYGFSAPPDQQPPAQPGYGAQGYNGGYAQPPPYASCAPACPPGPPYGGYPAQGYGAPAAPYGGYNPNIPGGFMQPGLQQPQQPNGYPGGTAPPQPQQPPAAAGGAANVAGSAAAANFMGFSLPPGSEYKS